MGPRTGWMLLLLMVLVSVLVMEAESRSPRRRRRGRGAERHRHHRDRPYHGRHHHHHRYDRGPGRWPGDFFRRLGFDHDFDFGWGDWPPFGRQRDWWEGPNVCESMEESNQTESDGNAIAHHHKMALQICEESETAYRCKSTIQSPEGVLTKIKLFQCCHGFSRKHREFGCPERLRMDDLLTTAQNLELNDLVKAIKTVGLDEELIRGNFTLFGPVDGGFPLPSGPGLMLQDQHGALMVSRPILDKMEDDLQAVLLGHVVDGPRRASSFADEEILETASPFGSTIRINFYSRPAKITTANCVRVKSTDNMATNGIIHTVERELPTVTATLMDIIDKDEDFSYLRTALGHANLVPELKGEGQITLFAPTNAAFQNLERRLLDRLLRGDSKCLEKVIKQHILPHVICSTIIQGRAKSRNILRNYLNLTRTEDDKVFVNGAQVVRADIMATNGVLHIIDAVLVPDDALDLVSVAKKNDLTEFVSLTGAVGIIPTLQKAENLTVFAPSNEAIKDLPPPVAEKLNSSDKAFLLSVLNYHVTTQDLSTRQLYNNRLLPTLDGDNKIRINEYSSFPFGDKRVMTAQCVPIVVPNVEACNGIVHVVDKILLPPEGNLVDVLAANPEYSTLVRLMKVSGLADSLQEEGPFTIFAPNNKAFEELGGEGLKELESNLDELANIIKMHIFQEHLCCTGIFYNPWWRHQRVRTLNGHSIFLTRNRHDLPAVNEVPIGSCDNMATNGVVHGIDSLLPIRDPWYMFP